MTTKIQNYIVVVRTPNGDCTEWKMAGSQVGSVLLSVQEICPECEIVRILRQGEW